MSIFSNSLFSKFFYFLSLLFFVFTNSLALENKTTLADLSQLPDHIWISHNAQILEGEQLEQYYSIIANLRCPVCQGQSLAESETQISLDLKNMVYQKISEGYSENEIKKILIDRYGYYIDFEPPVNNTTLPLWFFPFLIAFFGIGFVLYRTRKKRVFEKWK